MVEIRSACRFSFRFTGDLRRFTGDLRAGEESIAGDRRALVDGHLPESVNFL
jgi:hypothetical protein